MLTPRRSLMLLAGFAAFGCAYAVYAYLLGGIDGLPQLPVAALKRSDGTFRPPPRTVSPTQARLAQAFGPSAPEVQAAFYQNQFSFLNGDSLIVLASGPVPAAPNSTRVTFSPFSVAIFAKAKPLHLTPPGEVQEITTIHADKAIVEFDRHIANVSDMFRSAKPVRVELISDIEQTFDEPRRGTVHIENNQKSADPNKKLTVRTPGPVFYRKHDAKKGAPDAGPDVWTDAPVEIVDRQNLPRPIGADAPPTVAGQSDDARAAGAVAAMLSGARRPPPTVTAVGMRIYLQPDPPPGAPKPKKTSTGTNGLRRLEFVEQVLVSLWTDAGESVAGPVAAPAVPPSNEQRPKRNGFEPPPPALGAITGGLGIGAYQARALDRALLQIETRGPFAYDAERSLARFDVVPQSDPNLPNDVQVTKVPARGGLSTLYSQVLELELNGGPGGAPKAPNAPVLKRLHAWTHTAGRFLTVASQDDGMQAYGQDLVHEQSANRTVLTGAPLYVVRERNVLSAGQPQRAATLTSVPGTGPSRRAQVTVSGAGRVELYDATANAIAATAEWRTSLVQTTEVENGRERDLFTFTEAAKFDDPRADYWLKGNVLKLWLEPRAASTDPNAPREQAKPARVQAVGNVTSHSAEYDVDRADVLNVFFTDVKPRVVVGPPAPPVPAREPPKGAPPKGPVPGTPLAPAAPKPPDAVAKEPEKAEKPKPPYKLVARTIDTWVNRSTVPLPKGGAPKGPVPKDGAKPEPATVTRYKLDKARCEDDVTVHQDPTDATKPRGVDIAGRLLLIDGSDDGSVLTVFGTPTKPGEVHQEEMSLLGPKIVLDQVHNSAAVEGRGALTMPTSSDLAGGELKQAEVVVIHWRDSMLFRGALRSAEFAGKVYARQAESWVLCNSMLVKFDRPVYFNQAQRRAAASAEPNEKAKIDTVYCYPAPADAADDKAELEVKYSQSEYDKTGKLVKAQQLTASELKMEAKVRDGPNGEPYQRVEAFGPGVYRLWQMGERDVAPNPAAAQPAAQPAQPRSAEQEMKLTIVRFSGRMTAVDKGKVFQQARFEDNIDVVNVPAPDQAVQIDRHKLPPRSVLLTCSKELVVSSHKKGNGPPVQRIDASGNAFLRSDDYDGWGETITHDGKMVVLNGSEALPARITGRFGDRTSQAGKQIVYDRGAGTYKVFDSYGGSFGKPR